MECKSGVVCKDILIFSSHSVNSIAKCHLTYCTEEMSIFQTISYTNISKINGGITKTFLVLLLYCKALPSVFHNRNLGLQV